jgi:glycosyltransferase involved in cell wall biosynthesis
MKIGILGSRGIPNKYGGFEQFAEYLSLGLMEKGWEVWVYCSGSHSYQENTWKGVHLIHCKDPEDKIGTAGQFIYDLHCIRDSRKRNFDIIYQLGYTSSSIWHRLLPKTPVVVTNMDGLEWKRSKYTAPVRRFLKYAEKLAIKSSDFLVADSEAIQDYISREYHAESTFIPYGAQIFDDPQAKKIEAFGVKPYAYFLLIARMQADNHIEEIIQGVLQSSTSKVLLIIGNTNNGFGKYLQDKYAGEQIRFLGGIYEIELLDQLRYYARMYFHGHSAGGTNPSLLEAMASSALICAHDNPFNKAVLQHNAYFFKSPEHISEIIDKDIHKTEDHDFISKNLSVIRQKYSWPKIIDEYNHFFRKIVSK